VVLELWTGWNQILEGEIVLWSQSGVKIEFSEGEGSVDGTDLDVALGVPNLGHELEIVSGQSGVSFGSVGNNSSIELSFPFTSTEETFTVLPSTHTISNKVTNPNKL